MRRVRSDADTTGVIPILSRFQESLVAEWRALPIQPPIAMGLMVLPIVLVGGFAWALSLHATHLPATRWLLEGGPVELSTSLAFLAGSALAFLAARRARRESIGAFRFFVLFGVLCFVASMEEISWGQSLLDYDTPAAVERLNSQGEFNVHNLPGFDELNSFVLPAFGLIGLWMMWPSKRPLFQILRPPLLLTSYFSMIVLAGLTAFTAEWLVARFSFGMVMAWLSEVIELVMGLSCLIYAAWKARGLGR